MSSITAEEFYLNQFKQSKQMILNLPEILKEFAEIKCKEQRELVFKECKHIKFGTYGAKKDKILNAPTPEM